MMSALWEFAKTILAIAILGTLGWFGWSLWNDASRSSDETAPAATFNCRQALADLAKDYQCRESPSCTMTEYELNRIPKLETNISIYCN